MDSQHTPKKSNHKMKIRKEILLAVFLVQYVHLTAGQSVLSSLGSSVESWSSYIWNVISSGTNNSAPLWQQCSNTKDFSNIVFEKSSQTISTESKLLTAVEDHANERLKHPKADPDAITQRINDFHKVRKTVDEEYEKLLTATKTTKGISPTKLCPWARTLVEDETITKLLNSLHASLSADTSPLIDDLLHHMTGPTGEILCDWGHSPYEYLHAVYILVVVTEKKGYLLEAYANYLLYRFNNQGDCKYLKDDLTIDLQSLRRRLHTHVNDYNKVLSKRMEKVSREFQSCAEEASVRDETYFELEGAVQGFLLPLDISRSGQAPSEACSNIKRDSLTNREQYCLRQENECLAPMKTHCLGYVINCEETAEFVTACETENGQRYKWVKESNTPEKSLDTCESRIHHLNHPCFCTCVANDVDSFSTHTINLQPVEADVAENMIVTGVRFVVKNRVLQFQIQQGKLGDDWRILGHPQWKPIDDISEEIRANRLNKPLRGKHSRLEEQQDYYIVNERTVFNLDQLSVPFGHILTGVKFEMVPQKHLSNQIQIAILSRPFDAVSGKLTNVNDTSHVDRPPSRREQWMDKSDSERVLVLPGLDKSVPISTSKKDDWRRATLPFFDAKPLVSNPPTALGGFGIFHRYINQTPGTISLKFSSLDYGYYMEERQNRLEN